MCHAKCEVWVTLDSFTAFDGRTASSTGPLTYNVDFWLVQSRFLLVHSSFFISIVKNILLEPFWYIIYFICHITWAILSDIALTRQSRNW